MTGTSPFTTDELSGFLGCCRGNTSRKLAALEAGVLNVLLNPEAWAASRHPYRVAESLCAFFSNMGAIVNADRDRARIWLRQLAEQRFKESTV